MPDWAVYFETPDAPIVVRSQTLPSICKILLLSRHHPKPEPTILYPPSQAHL